MAVLIPETPKDCVNSERQVFERLGRELPDNCVVLHSLGLAGHEKKIWGEADIVILSNHGVFALEVKGGTVSCADGIWTYSGDFPSFTKKESPWQQASGAMFAVKNLLEKANGSFKDIMFGFGVVMPYTAFTTTGAEIEQDVLLDKRQFRAPLSQYIAALSRYWEGWHNDRHRHCRGLRDDEIRTARQILRPDLETALSIGSYLTGTETQLIYLSNQQIKASRRMASNPRTITRGAAGTGKSVIALERARQLSADGKRVLYICYNQLLASHVRAGLVDKADSDNITVFHIHALYRGIINEAGFEARLKEVDQDSKDFFSKTFPQLAADALCDHEFEPWDVLVIDEAQDLLTPEHLDAFDLLLSGGLRQGKWHIFHDRQQNIYGVDVQEEVERRLEDCAPAFEDLFENCRNTREVALEASIISGIDLAIEGAPQGLAVGTHSYATDDEGLEILESTLCKLLESDVKVSDIVLLSTRKKENSLLANTNNIAGRPLASPDDRRALENGAILVSTMHAFKGLERQVVIAFDMSEIGDEKWSMLHYAGLSRARGLLHVFMPKSAAKSYSGQAEAYGRRIRALTS